MRILSIGNLSGLSNTCLHRHWALSKIADCIDSVDTSGKTTIGYRIAYHLFLLGLPIYLPERNNENELILELIKKNKYDIVWIDKGLTIYPNTLKYIHNISPYTKIVHYSPDNMALRHNQSQQYLESIHLYDVEFTTKSYIIDYMKKIGSKNIIFTDMSYEATFHYPRILSKADIERLGCDVGFIGMWEKDRCNSLCYLAQNGIKVRVYGSGKWNDYKEYNPNLEIIDHGLFDDDYAKAFRAFKISLCFLRKINNDKQTSRTMEIPACGGFMIAERTDEHQRLFREDKEAVFFSSNEELLVKCRYYLEHEDEREKIAKAGHQRCVESGYSNDATIHRLLKLIDVKNC